MDFGESEFMFEDSDYFTDMSDDTGFDNDELDISNSHDFGDEEDVTMLMSIAEESANKKYDVDENTDSENWERAMEFVPIGKHRNGGRGLRRFEQYISDICEGRRSLFED